MKKALLFLAVLCVAGIFSAKAQYSSSDSAYVRELRSTTINTSTFPVTITDTLGDTNTKFLYDIRPGKRGRLFSFTLAAPTDLDIFLASGGWDSYLFLLNSQFRLITYNDDCDAGSSTGSQILRHLNAGRYYIVVSEYNSSSTPESFSLTLKAGSWTTLSTAPCVSMNVNDTVSDSLTVSDRLLTDHYRNCNSFVKGYSIQTPANAESIEISIDANFDEYLYLLDENRHVIKATDNYYISSLVNPSSTYYILVTSYYSDDIGEFDLSTELNTSIPTYYIDGVNGDDDSTGLTPSSPLLTLEKAAYLSSNNGENYAKFYLIDDYTFSNSTTIEYQNNIKVLPYQRDIRLYMPTSGSSDLMASDYQLIFGDKNGNYDFIIDSSTSTGYDELFEVYYEDTYLEINNLKVRNSIIPSNFAYVYSLVMNNCEFINDSTNENLFETDYEYATIDILNSTFSQSYFDGLIYLYDEYNKLTMKNSTVSQCSFDDFFIKLYDEYCSTTLDSCTITQCNADYFLYNDEYYGSITLKNTNITHNTAYYMFYPYYECSFTMENSNWTDNSSDNGIWFYTSEVNLISGTWCNNSVSAPVSYCANPNLTANNWGGINLWDQVTLNIGPSFSMDTTNLITFDSTCTINITENITVPHTATLYPYLYDDSIRNYYYVGYQVIFGDSTVLANNFRKFKMAQVDTVMWYIHEDGKIYNDPVPEPPVGLTAADGTIKLFPNPATDILNIAIEGTAITEVNIIDMYGKTAIRAKISEGANTVNISHLPAGMYFVQLRAADSVKATQKLVKR